MVGELDKIENPAEELRKIRKEKRKLIARENQLKGTKKVLKDLESFKKLIKLKEQIKDLRNETHKKCEKLAKDNGTSLNTLAKLPNTLYIYQHPTDKVLKSNDKTDEWVKRATTERENSITYTLDMLETTALNTQLKAFNRKRKRKKTDTTKKKSDTSKTKTKVIGSRGIR